MIKLGVSVYPEKVTLDQINEYLKMASKYGFTKVFTSLFSVPGTKDEIIDYFKKLTKIAHQYNMVVSGDANTEFIKQMGADETNLSVFKEMGIDIIRMDFCYGDKRDVKLINNNVGIKIEMSARAIDKIELAIQNGANIENLTTCHNFYPERYTGPAVDKIYQINEHWKSKNVKVAIFISSRVEGAHGPWPVNDGLPTLEEHRDLPVDVQLKHCLAMNNIDEVLFGNAFASEEEFKLIRKVMDESYINVQTNESLGIITQFLPSGNIKRVPFKIHLDNGITEIEKEILFKFPVHADLGDSLNYMLRSRWTRIIYAGKSIPMRKYEKKYYTRGDVVIVNDNLEYYRGEIQIVLKDMKVDGQRNFIGRIDNDEIMLLDYIKEKDVFTFIE